MMGLYIGIDVSKDKFDACGITEGGGKVFSITSDLPPKYRS
jgi:transposase